MPTPPAPPADATAPLRALFEQVSGLDTASWPGDAPFVALGVDSLALTQAALAVSKRFGTKVTFRQLSEQLPTLDALAAHLGVAAPTVAPDVIPAAVSNALPPGPAAPGVTAPAPPHPAAPRRPDRTPQVTASHAPGVVHDLIQQQLDLMRQQLALLGTSPVEPAPNATPTAAVEAPAALAPDDTAPNDTAPNGAAPPAGAAATNGTDPAAPSVGPARALYDATKAFGAAPRITVAPRDGEALTPRQRARLDAFVRRYTARTAASKRYAESHRPGMADPRAATGFRPAVKELVYPLVMERSAGARMWDLDGNEYVDVLCGFGSNLFGWSPPFVVDAVKAQLDQGFDVGPQTPLAGEVADLVREVTGHERVAFCNTGSEAVLGAVRVARTVTGRETVALFTGSYHGINDEALVRGARDGRAIPAAPGILSGAVGDVLVLDYGTDETLRRLEARAADLAAVVVEPVQSRRPDFQPAEFLRALRALCTRHEIVLIWDEVVTGFRVAPGGAQEHFDVRADLAAYGKVIGGGLPVGVIAGRRDLMDALDGGQWRYGDASVPEVGVTYFAGTFVRHPLALAAARAVLLHLREAGPALQRTLNARTTEWAARLSADLAAAGAPLTVRHFASLWRLTWTGEKPPAHADLLFYLLRERGVHVWDGFPCFFTTAHTDADLALVADAVRGAVSELQEGGFLPPPPADAPPVPGARLGRDRDGTPAWFAPNPDAPGRFVRVAGV